LNAVIELKNDKTDRPKESRAMRHVANGTPIPYVELNTGQYLFIMLMDAGPIKSGAMGGHMALDWVDLHAYVSLTAGSLDEWEASLIMEMSQAYASGMSEGTSPFSKAPIERKTNAAP
jgi:hypothetical protein